MAREAQAVTIGSTTSPDNTVIDISPLTRNPQSPIQPLSVVSFRGSFELDGSSAGNTADCRVTFPLPGNHAYQLHSFMFSVEDTSQYDEGLFELYYSTKPTEFGATTQLNFPMVRTSTILLPDSSQGFHSFQLGTQEDTASSVYTPLQYESSPFRFLTTGSAAGGTDPVVWIGSGSTTGISGGTARIAVTFLQYSIEQLLAAPLYTGLSTR